MITIKYIYNKVAAGLCMLVASISISSCMNFDPEAEMGDNLVWNKADNFQLFANQFYGWTRDLQLSTSYTYGNAYSDGPHSDFRSDLLAAASINTYSQGTNTIPATDSNYGTLYTRIYNTNLLIKNAEGFSNPEAIATPLGEAYWFRAYLHFELVQIYGDCILLTEPLDLDSPQLQQERDDRGVVIDQIIADLEQAAELLPAKPTEDGRLSVDAANAMLSRVALYEGTWQKFHTGNGSNTERSKALLEKAKSASKAVLEAGNYSLFYDATLGNNSYRYMFCLEDETCNPAGITKSGNTEYILAHRHRIGDKTGLNVTKATLGGTGCFITRKLANMYLCQDGLPIGKSTVFKGYSLINDEYQNRDNRMTNTMLTNGEKYWSNVKYRTAWNDDDLSSALTANVANNSGYQNRKWAVERKVDDYYESMDYPVIRYAEVLLNFAEAIYELQDRISDSDLDKSLNLVRQRVNPNMPKLSNAFVETNGLSMREEIRRERTVELFLEGFRIDDLKRWKTAEVEMPQNQVGVLYTGTEFESKWPTQSRSLDGEGCIILYGDRSWAQKNYLYPIPSDERQLNPQLGQNPGWTND